eukprot:10835111-Alexandrium_andersonii.AAC.1
MRNCVGRSKLELRGAQQQPQDLAPKALERCVSRRCFFALIPNLMTKGAVLEAPRGFRVGGW